MCSLRARLLLGTALGMAVVLSAAGLLLYGLVRARLVAEFDRTLIGQARLLASAVEAEFGEPDLSFEDLDMGEFDEVDGSAYMELWRTDGSVAFRSLSLGENDLAPVTGAADPTVCRWVILPDGNAGRAVGFTFRPWSDFDDEPAEELTLVVARDSAPMAATLGRLRGLLASVGSVAVLLSVAVLWAVIGAGMRPLRQVAAQISGIGEENLSARVDPPNVPKELQVVAERLNDLLARLEAAFQRERSFSSNVAHELRTPLAGLRSITEVALSKPREGGEYEEALRDSLQITAQLQGIVENLLSLARLDAGQVEIARANVPLDELMRACWAAGADRAEQRQLQVQWDLAPEATVTVDPALLELALRNVFENALAYADEGGAVRIETEVGADSVDLRVSNSGSLLSQDEAEHVFERFWRGDEARTDAGVRCGLGLSLVKRIAEVLGGRASARSSAGGEFQTTVSLPRSDMP